MRSVVLAACLTILFQGCGGGSAPRAEPAGLAIVGAQLIDGTGGEPIPDSVLLIHDGRIQAAGTRGATPVPEGAHVVDAAGKTIIPGLIDTHSHYRGDATSIERQFNAQVFFGVTSARSIGSDPPENIPVMRATHTPRPGIPRVFTAGRGFSYPDGFPPGNSAHQPRTPEEARELVRGLAEQGVHFTKMWVNEMPEPGHKIPPEIRAAIVDESLKNSLLPVAHIDEEADGRQLVEAGLRDFLHTTVRTFGPGAGVPMDDASVSEEFLQMCVDNGVSFSPTLSIIQNNWHFAERPELLDDPQVRAAFASYDSQAPTLWGDPEARAAVVHAPGFADRKASFQQVLDFVETIHQAGVGLALGTDSGTANVPFGWAVHHELELYVEAGLTPMQAIVAATAGGARLMPPVGAADFGTLEVGKIADLVLLSADPLRDIRNTLAIDRVMQGGEWVDRDGLLIDLAPPGR